MYPDQFAGWSGSSLQHRRTGTAIFFRGRTSFRGAGRARGLRETEPAAERCTSFGRHLAPLWGETHCQAVEPRQLSVDWRGFPCVIYGT
jgi:hypothetical protein